MSFYLHKAPRWIQKLYSKRIWMMDASEKSIFLTFDDGPDPEITPQILDLFSKSGAKVTFFHLGSKAEQYPSLVKRCKAEGHTVGNHGYHHLDGYKISDGTYFNNLEKGKDINQANLFRPPYGRIKWSQKKRTFQSNTVVMGDIMVGDYDENMSVNDCVNVIKKYTENGSVIVLHENEKSKDKVVEIVKMILSHFQNEGFQFHSLAELI